MTLVLILYCVLFAIAVFGPLRWSIAAFVLLSTLDFGFSGEHIGMLNTAKGLILPLYLLWRLRDYSGHQKVILAPIAWTLLMAYAAVAGFWSMFPVSALKLAGHMAGSLLICFVFMRATKGGFLGFRLLVPVTIGTLALGVLCSVLQPDWAGNEGRFSSFTTAQAYASLLAALYSLALCARTLRLPVRLTIAAALAIALVFNGSRIWTLGIIIATLVALLVSNAKAWVKVSGIGSIVILIAILVGSADRVMNLLAEYSESNRIAAAITAAYEGDNRSAGLGTYRFRRGADAKEIAGIENSSLLELLFGHGTSNGALLVVGSHMGPTFDPNRRMHNEWLRVMYEWGICGAILWLLCIGSIALYALRGLKLETRDYAKPLVVYLPAFLMGLAGENIIAGAGSAVNVGFLMLIALASVSHRQLKKPLPRRLRTAETPDPVLSSQPRGVPSPPHKWPAPSVVGPVS